MKRLFCFCVVIFLFLTACSGDEGNTEMQKAVDFRTALMSAGGCSFQAQVRADYGERVYDFTLSCEYIPDQEARLTVLEPDTIADISAVVTQDGAHVQFDGMELDFGQLANGRVAPMALPWLLGKGWSSEYISSAGKDGDLILVTYLMGYGDDEVILETWLDQTGIPVRCDVSYDGQRCVAVTVSDFRYQ